MQQLSGMDAMFVTQETERTPMHISVFVICDPASARGGKVRFKDVLARFEDRLDLTPVFRRKLVNVPMGLDNPYWIEDEDFDLEFHVRHIALPEPGDWRQLCIQLARLQARGLDMSRPLWEAYIIEGLDNVQGLPAGCFAMLLKVHHSAVDGVSGTQILETIVDQQAHPRKRGRKQRRDWAPEDRPSDLSLLARAWLHNVRQPAQAWNTVMHLVPAIGRVREGIREQRFGQISRDSTQTRFDKVIGSHRVVEGVFLELDEVKSIKDAIEGSTVNDVIAAVVSGALRHYLQSKGELPDNGLLAVCPINVRDPKDRSGGNQVSVMRINLATDVEDPIARLEQIHEDTAASKEYANAVGASALTDLSQVLPPRMAALGMRAATSFMLRSGVTPPVNTVVSNVPGPQQPLYFCGARLVRAGGFGPLLDGLGVFHAVFSYNGQISIMVSACRDLLPDPEFYAQCLQESFYELQDAVAEL